MTTQGTCAHCGGTGTCTYLKNRFCAACGRPQTYDNRPCSTCKGTGRAPR